MASLSHRMYTRYYNHIFSYDEQGGQLGQAYFMNGNGETLLPTLVFYFMELKLLCTCMYYMISVVSGECFNWNGGVSVEIVSTR